MFSSYARIIRSPRYCPIWLGQLVSSLGDAVNYIALVITVYRLTGSGLALSTLVVVQVAPVIVAGPVAGTLGLSTARLGTDDEMVREVSIQ